MRTRISWLLVLWLLALFLVRCTSGAAAGDPGQEEAGGDGSAEQADASNSGEGDAAITTDGGITPGDASGSDASADSSSAPASTDALLSALTISAASLSPAFAPTTLVYHAGPVRVPSPISMPGVSSGTTVTATVQDPQATIKVNGVAVASSVASPLITLSPSLTTIAVDVMAGDGKTSKSYTIAVSAGPNDYLKASNPRPNASFFHVALSSDGNTLAVGATGEPSAASGVDASQNDTSAQNAGAVYVYTRTGATWSQQAYIKASNTRASAFFGWSVGLSGDGNTLAVGAIGESSNAKGLDGDQTDTSMANAGAVYVFVRSGTQWSQQSYVKASNTRPADFGSSVAFSSDGSVLAVGANCEPSSATGVNGDQTDTSALCAGAVYLFRRSGSSWTQEAYVKASNARAGACFGIRLAVSGDGSTLAVGSNYESSNASGINGNQLDTSATAAGAVYVFKYDGATWAQEAYVKPSNTRQDTAFGVGVTLSDDGNTLAVGAEHESSNSSGINGNQNGFPLSTQSGAAYVFVRSGSTWSQQAYIKASNAQAYGLFGIATSLTGDGSSLAVGALTQSGGAAGIDGNQSDVTMQGAGAVYLFTRTGTTWTQRHYVKASNPHAGEEFGAAVVWSRDGSTLAVGAPGDSSGSAGVNGNQNDSSVGVSGAAYVF